MDTKKLETIRERKEWTRILYFIGIFIILVVLVCFWGCLSDVQLPEKDIFCDNIEEEQESVRILEHNADVYYKVAADIIVYSNWDEKNQRDFQRMKTKGDIAKVDAIKLQEKIDDCKLTVAKNDTEEENESK